MQSSNIIEEFICCSCKIKQPKTSFYKNKGRCTGYQAYCKSCKKSTRDYTKEYQQRKIRFEKSPHKLEKDKIKRRQYAAKIRQEYPWKKRYYENLRRAAKLKATPKWADLEAIKQFYLNCPEGYHVDHIVPLQGKIVCGLHVLNNLQYLTAEENIKKSNRF